MNASQAKKAAQTNKQRTEEERESKKHDARAADIDLLLGEFHKKIDEAVEAGKLSTDKLSFSNTRFHESVITEVVTALRAEGYYVTMDKHNAYQTLKFTVGWA